MKSTDVFAGISGRFGIRRNPAAAPDLATPAASNPADGSGALRAANLKLLLVLPAALALALALGVATAVASPAAPTISMNPELPAHEPTDTTMLVFAGVVPNESEISDCHFVYGIGSASGNTAPCDPSHPEVHERQTVTVQAASGQFRLSFESETTADLAYDAPPAAVQAALEGLASIGAGGISVTGGPGGVDGEQHPYVMVFALGGIDLPQIQAENGTVPLGGEVSIKTTKPGHATQNEQQTLTVFGVSGQFRLGFESDTTGDLPYTASAAEIQTALEGLASIGAGNVTVAGSESTGYSPFTVTFQGDLAKQDVPALGFVQGTPPLAGTIQAGTQANGNRTDLVGVSGLLTGLSPDTEYRYKLVAKNEIGTSEGPEAYFRTLSKIEAEGPCANQAIRVVQHAAPAECRAYEMVSPADKNNNDVAGEEVNVVAATDGNAAVFQSHGGFAGTVGSGRTGFTQYVSRRGEGGWSTKAMDPTPPGGALQALTGGTEFFLFSDDLRKAVLWGYDLPQLDDDDPDNDNLYQQDTDTGALQTVTLATQQSGDSSPYFGNGENWGGSSDTGVVAFATATRLLPEATAGVRNAYEWDHGTLRLAGILPNGSVPSGGTEPPRDYRAGVSSDGSRVLFMTLEGNRQLYLRRDHSDTVWISESEGAPVAEPEAVELQWVSPEADKILFTTTSPLLAGDVNGGEDVYLYTDSPDPESQSNLSRITTGSADYTVLGASDDASRIYIYDTSSELRLWQQGGSRLIGYISGAGASRPMDSPGASRVTHDGRFLAFVEGQMYLYDAVSNTLACASCDPSGPTESAVALVPSLHEGILRKSVWQLRPRYLSEDGRRVFFSTAEALVPGDTNGVVDTYVYNARTAHRQLVSSGTGEDSAYFENASSSGDDAFFVTAQPLVGADGDHLVDLYDARVGGGFPEPPPPPTPCSGDNCRNALSTAPGGASPATTAFSGPGNVKPVQRCRKGKHQVRRGGKLRCVKKKKHRPAGSKRGTSR